MKRVTLGVMAIATGLVAGMLIDAIRHGESALVWIDAGLLFACCIMTSLLWRDVRIEQQDRAASRRAHPASQARQQQPTPYRSAEDDPNWPDYAAGIHRTGDHDE